MMSYWITRIVYLLFQVRDNAMKPPAVMEAPATTMGMLSAAPAHPVGEETRATQVWNASYEANGWCQMYVVV